MLTNKKILIEKYEKEICKNCETKCKKEIFIVSHTQEAEKKIIIVKCANYKKKKKVCVHDTEKS